VAMAPFYPVATARELNRWWHFTSSTFCLLCCKLWAVHSWRLSCIPGIVKLWESPGTAGGLLRRN